MTHACAVVDYFEDVIGLTRHDEISEEFAFFLDWRLSRWCCGPNPCRESVRLASWEGVVILSRGFCGEGSMDLLAAQILPSRRTWGSRLLQACHPEARVLCGPRAEGSAVCRHHWRCRDELFWVWKDYCQTARGIPPSERKGAGVRLRSRSFIAEWQTIHDRCVLFPSSETRA